MVTLVDIIYEFMKWAIVVAALFMAYAEFGQALRYKRSWYKWGLGTMGLYWAIYYIYFIIWSISDSYYSDGRVFVRAGILITLSLVAAGALLSLKDLKRLGK